MNGIKMNISMVRKKIGKLYAEERKLKKSLAEIEEKLLKKSSSSRFKSSTDIGATSTSVISIGKISYLRKWLNLSQKVNQVTFTNEEVSQLDDGMSQCVTDAVIGPTNFHISMIIQNMDTQKNIVIKSMKVKLEDLFQEKELKPWINRCVRQRDFQILIKGGVSYAEWYKNREDVTNWIKADYGSHYTIQRSEEDGYYTIVATAGNFNSPLFHCNWSILWNPCASCMIPSFTFRMKRTSKFLKENEYLFKKLSSVEVTPNEVMEMWQAVSINVRAAGDSDFYSSESESEIS